MSRTSGDRATEIWTKSWAATVLQGSLSEKGKVPVCGTRLDAGFFSSQAEKIDTERVYDFGAIDGGSTQNMLAVKGRNPEMLTRGLCSLSLSWNHRRGLLLISHSCLLVQAFLLLIFLFITTFLLSRSWFIQIRVIVKSCTDRAYTRLLVCQWININKTGKPEKLDFLFCRLFLR